MYIKGVQDLYEDYHSKQEDDEYLYLQSKDKEMERLKNEEDKRKRLNELTNIDDDIKDKMMEEQLISVTDGLDPKILDLYLVVTKLNREVNEIKERKKAALRSRESIVNAKEASSQELNDLNKKYRNLCNALKSARKINKRSSGEDVINSSSEIRELEIQKEDVQRAIERAEPQYKTASNVLEETDTGVQRLQTILIQKQQQILKVKEAIDNYIEELSKLKSKYKNQEDDACKQQVILDKALSDNEYRMNLINVYYLIYYRLN